MRLSARPKPWAVIAVAASLAAATTPAGTAEWEVTTESVATLAYNSTNIATIWGYHQPMIVRSGERVYCALLEAHGDGFAQHWSLYARDEGGWRRLWKGLGLALLVYGALMLVGLAAGGKDTIQPLRGLAPGGGTGQAAHASFKRIKTAADLDRELTAARAAGKPVLVNVWLDKTEFREGSISM